MTNAVTLTHAQAQRLIDAIGTYDGNPEYDSVFLEVQERIKETREAGKADIAIIAFWKRLRLDATWVRELLSTPDANVRKATRAAFKEVDDRRALAELGKLAGFGASGALATALLCAYDPNRWPVMDRNAFTGLRELGRPVDREAVAYFAAVRQLRVELEPHRPATTVREIDKALFTIGKQVLDQRRRAETEKKRHQKARRGRP